MIEMLNSFDRKLVFKLVRVLPVKNISFFNHSVNIILDVPNQRYLMHIELLEKVYKLLLHLHIQLPYPFLTLLSS
jgi:hypothetical protein